MDKAKIELGLEFLRQYHQKKIEAANATIKHSVDMLSVLAEISRIVEMAENKQSANQTQEIIQ